MEKLTLIKIRNPFDRADQDIVTAEYHGESLLEIRDANIPKGMPVTISINGILIEEFEISNLKSVDLSKVYPRAGDQILFMPRIEGGGGGDNKSVLRIILMIVVAVVAWYAAPLITGVQAGMMTSLVAGAIMVVGGLIVNALLPPPKAKLPTMDNNDYDNSQAYGWNPQTLQAQGPVVPKWFGLNRLYGNIIAANIETLGNKSYCNALIDLGLGPINRLYDFKLNDQPYENFRGVALETRYGNLDQPPVNAFVQTKNEYPLSVKIVKGAPYTYTTIGNAFHALEVEVTFPQGLFYANDSGGLDQNEVDMRISIRRKNAAEWRVITSSIVTKQVAVYGGRWSAGRWVPDEHEPGAGGENNGESGGAGGGGYGQAGDETA